MTITKMDKLKIGVIAFGVIIVIVLLVGIFRYWSFKPPNNYDLLIAQKDSTIKAYIEQRESLYLLLDEKDRERHEHEINDSLAAVQFSKGQQVHNILNDKAITVISHINAISGDNDSLRAIANTY